MDEEIKEGDRVTITVWPHERREGNVVVAILGEDGLMHYNVWLVDNNDMLGFDEGELKKL